MSAAAAAQPDNERKPSVSAAADKEPLEGDEVALITGSASGIGRGTALAFAALGFRLVLVDKQADRLSETARDCAARSPKKHQVSVWKTSSIS